MDESQNIYRVTIRKDYAESLLQDLQTIGAVELELLNAAAVRDAEDVTRRSRAADESKAAEEKFKNFLDSAGR